jgi:hypothetical protein
MNSRGFVNNFLKLSSLLKFQILEPPLPFISDGINLITLNFNDINN